MPQYVISTPETKSIKKIITKFSDRVPVDNKNIRGYFTIKNIRKYQFRVEVDIAFKGEIQARIGRNIDWYDNTILNQELKGYKISKIKLNRFMRKSIFQEVKNNLRYYSEELKNYSDIIKIQWL